ncbi:type VI secretion protein [Vibrio panuliri]|uniref:Type VI secretion protein n=1 Tax=Vibrio panuliri TaxID=1381081 RepID=A0A1Q9HJX8_9VIBR|nr:type VI secretion system ImpA family N-terminal domain-containing protein [Vibrio panuliri]OLQ90617.1 type VI secretion protein [Vibrio panuliri]
MSKTVLLDQVVYHITPDSQSIRNREEYQKVRDEINGRFNPLSGGTQWLEVHHACEQLAKGPGIDLLMCGYLTVAKLKIEGLSGYANGLELLMQCLTILPEPDSKTAKKRKEVLSWVNSKVLPELKQLKPTQEQLRALYRCENMCDRIHQWMALQQPDVSVDFDGVGYVLFEHIDHIETRYHTAIKRQDKQSKSAGYITPKRHRLSLLATGLLTTMTSLTALWLYYNPNVFNPYPFQQTVTTPVLTQSNLDDYLANTKPARVLAVQSELVPLYQMAIEANSHVSVEQPYLKAIEQLNVLQALYANDVQVEQIGHKLQKNQHEAIEQADQFVARFSEMRTRMANIALLAKNQRWSQVANETKSLEEFAVSLSPIYGRVGYVETLIANDQQQLAMEEFEELKRRLNHLSWKVVQLQQLLAE